MPGIRIWARRFRVSKVIWRSTLFVLDALVSLQASYGAGPGCRAPSSDVDISLKVLPRATVAAQSVAIRHRAVNGLNHIERRMRRERGGFVLSRFSNSVPVQSLWLQRFS